MNNSGRLGRSSATIFGTSLDRAFRFSFHFHANLTGKRVDKADCGNVCDWLPSGGKCFGEKANSKKSGSVLAPTRRWYVNAKLMRQAKKKKRKTFSAQGSEAETKGPRRRKASKPTHASLGVTPSSARRHRQTRPAPRMLTVQAAGAWEILPRMAGPLAPVAEGRFAGRW